MSTVREMIQRVDAIKPNCFEEGTKAKWLGELDARIALSIMLMDIVEAQRFNYGAEDMDVELLAQFPHDSIYESWLMSRIDYASGDYNRYANSSALFNAEYTDYLRWFCNTYDPAQRESQVTENG